LVEQLSEDGLESPKHVAITCEFKERLGTVFVALEREMSEQTLFRSLSIFGQCPVNLNISAQKKKHWPFRWAPKQKMTIFYKRALKNFN
jgi:hypothetical protein